MAVTGLDTTAALILIDLQKSTAGLPTVHPAHEIAARAGKLAHAFRQCGLSVVLVNEAGTMPGRTDARISKGAFPNDWAELVPELNQHPGDYTVTKQWEDAFTGTILDDILRDQGVTQVFLAGIATGSGVELTARSAYALGYKVVLVVDAMSDTDADVHRNCVEKTFPRIGEIDTTQNVLMLLAPMGEAA
jgi:nicotinamidase-related amidase